MRCASIPRCAAPRIGRRLYEERAQAGRTARPEGHRLRRAHAQPASAAGAGSMSPQDYLDQVIAGKLHDPVLRFQLANGFEPIGILENYLPEDKALARQRGAHGLAQSLRRPGRQPQVPRAARCRERAHRHLPAAGARGEGLRRVHAARCEYFVDVAADYEADFIVFPEMFTLMLLSAEEKELIPLEGIEALSRLHAAHPQGAERDGAAATTSTSSAARTPRGWTTATSTTSPTSACATDRSTSRRRSTPPRTRPIGGTSRAAIQHRRHPDRLRPDRRADLLRQRVPRTGPPAGRRRRADHLRAVLHRQPPGLHARALLRRRRGRSRTSATS